jgi:acetyl-CoA synthetase
VRRLEFAELPKTISGKIRRVELRTQEEQRAGDRAEREYREEDFPELKASREPSDPQLEVGKESR